MPATSDQLRAARVLLRLEQSDLARRAQTSIVTIRRLEAPDGHRRVAPATIGIIQTALEQAGAEFIPHGVRRRQPPDTLLDDLRAISHRSAARLQGQPLTTDADHYDAHGRPS